MFSLPSTWKRIYDISFYIYCALSLANLIFLLVLTIRSAETDYETINRWDAIYHGHNLGAHFFTVVTVVNMWRPKGFIRSPALSIVHFVGTEAVKLYFAIEWAKYWPNQDSAFWLVSNLAALNATSPTDESYAEKIEVFDRVTDKFGIQWNASGVASIPPTAVFDANLEKFLDWARQRTYKMKNPVLGLASATTAVGCLVCGLAYLYFRLLKKPKDEKQVRIEATLQSVVS
jgi:hypothetical protein